MNTVDSLVASLVKLTELGERLLALKENISFEEQLEEFAAGCERIVPNVREPLTDHQRQAIVAVVQVHSLILERAKSLKSGVENRLAALERNRPALIKYSLNKTKA